MVKVRTHKELKVWQDAMDAAMNIFDITKGLPLEEKYSPVDQIRRSSQRKARGFSSRSVEIIDIHKLREEMGEKTVAVDAFEGKNLVLVDEGHRGASSADKGIWT